MTNSDISNSINLDHELCYFGSQDSISVHPFELDQTSNIENLIDILVSFPFPEIELEHEYDSKSQLGISISLLESILTLVSFPHFNHFLSQH